MTLLNTLAKLLLITLLIFISMGNIMNALINPEAYLIYLKLAGLNASIYLLLNGLIPILLIYLVAKAETRIWSISSSTFFIFHLVNSICISVTIFRRPSFSVISLIGLVLSLAPLLRDLVRR